MYANYKKNFFDQTVIKQICEQVSILDVAAEYGLTVVRVGDKYSLKEHDSVVIYPETNSFFRHATNAGGNVFNFVKEIPEIDVSFKDFYFQSLKKIDRSITPAEKTINNKPKKITEYKTDTFNINETLKQCHEREKNLLRQVRFDDNYRNVRAFLIQTRVLDPDIVNEFINKGLIKQGIAQNGQKNVLFIGYNDVGIISAINVRSAYQKGFKGDLRHCNYAYGWHYDPDINNYQQLQNTEFYTKKPLVVFEGYIDMMAYISTLKEQGIDYHQYSYLTCGSVSKYRSVIATCQSNYYREIICCFDNDKAGDLYSDILREKLIEEFGDEIKFKREKSILKDWDEDRMKNQKKSINSRIKDAKQMKQNMQQFQKNSLHKKLDIVK